MASEASPSTFSLGANGPSSSPPTRASFHPSTECMGDITISNLVTTAALSEKPPIPPRNARHSLVVDNGRSLHLLKEIPAPESSNSTQSHFGRTEHCLWKGRPSSACATTARNSMHLAKTQRWCGLTRTASEWDGLRRDSELWYEDGDCYVHLNGSGASRRGPSFCIPFRILRQKKCSHMLTLCEAQMTSTTGPLPQQPMHKLSSLNAPTRASNTVHLFIPAPEAASREDSYKWHITTRNFFAFLLGKPLVGGHMGQAFVDLQERIQLFRPEHPTNQQEFLDYADNQGYRDLVDWADYALANLFYAEHFKLRSVWIDAFAHCVGMNDSLGLSSEYILNSRLTKALITRARHEVDIHLNRVSKALSRFLDQDLSPTYLGLTPGARIHLDRFRRLLHSFYAEKFGYWPPPRGSTFPKSLYKSMYYDFKILYDYLVDTESTTDLANQKPASGGICILQNVGSFDKRHNFEAQPHPLPLLPTYTPPPKRTDSQRALRQLTLGSQHDRTHQAHTMNANLAVATNNLSKDEASSKIIQVYMQFEMDASQREEKISAVDARKVRWLLIYGTLQYLVSALRAPSEVRDFETPDYPLCCLIAGQPTPDEDNKVTIPMSVPTSQSQAPDNFFSEPLLSASIQPDCQREDYFSSKPTSRRGSADVLPSSKPPKPTRSASARSFRPLSLAGRVSRKNSQTLRQRQHCAIIVQGYGDGLNETISAPSSQNSSRRHSLYSEQSVNSAPLSARHSLISRPRTPLLDMTQLDKSAAGVSASATNEPPTRSDSTSSTGSSVWSEGDSAASSQSSANEARFSMAKHNAAEYSGLLGGLVPVSESPVESLRTQSLTRASIPQSHAHPLIRRASKQDGLRFSIINQSSEDTALSSLSQNVNPTAKSALSTPLSPPLRPICESQASTRPVEIKPSTDEERPPMPKKSITIAIPPTTATAPVPSKKGRSTDIFAALVSPTSEAWQQCKASISRPTTAGTDTTLTPSTKSSFSFKFPSFASTKAGNEDEQTKKKDKRRSLSWRR